VVRLPSTPAAEKQDREDAWRWRGRDCARRWIRVKWAERTRQPSRW